MNTPQHKRPVFMYILGSVIIIGVALYALFSGVDRLFLQPYSTEAVVDKKDYFPPGVTNSTQLIGGRTQSVPVATDEQFIITLNSRAKMLKACVNKQRYQAITIGDTMNITCRKRRISGKIDIVSVD